MQILRQVINTAGWGPKTNVIYGRTMNSSENQRETASPVWLARPNRLLLSPKRQREYTSDTSIWITNNHVTLPLQLTRAARFVTGNYNYETGSMTGILGQLKWESLKKRRKDNRLILLYKGLKGKASVPTDDLIPKTRRCRNQHSMAFQTPIANTDVYKGSFFPQTIRDWNALPDSLISSAEDAEDCVAKFISLVRARDLIP